MGRSAISLRRCIDACRHVLSDYVCVNTQKINVGTWTAVVVYLYLCCSCDKMDRLLFFLLSLCFLARVVTGQVLLSLFLFLSFCRYLKELRSVSSSLFHIFSLHIFFNSISLHLYINIIFDGGIRRATPHSEPYLCMLAVSQRYASLILVIELRGDKLTHIHFCVKVFATRSNL